MTIDTRAHDLKLLRRKTGLTQAVFAEMMGVPLRTLQNLENGKSAVRDVHLNAARWAVYTTQERKPLPNTKGLPK